MHRLFSAVATLLTAALFAATIPLPASAAANRPPVLRAIADVVAAQGHAIRIAPKASDPDRRPRALRFSASGRPAWLSLHTSTGVMTGRAPASAIGKRWNITVRVTDGAARRSRSFTLRVVANRPPQLARIPAQTATIGEKFTYQLRGSDPDRGPQPLVYVKARGPEWLSVNRHTGVVTGTAPEPPKTFSPIFQVNDGNKLARRTMTLETVNPPTPDNAAPVVEDQTFTVDENLPGAEVGTVAATDADGNELSFSITGGSDLFTIDETTGELTTTQALDFEAAAGHDLTVQVSDAQEIDTAAIKVNVTDTNDAPVIDSPADATVDEDQPITGIDISANDQDGDPVTLDVAGLPTGLRFDAEAGSVVGTPTVPGNSSVAVTATDGNAGTDTATFVLTVRNVNDAPVAGEQALSVVEGAAPGTEIGVLTASDEDGDELAFSGTSDEFDVAADGTVTVAEGANLGNGSGPFTFDYEVFDGTESSTGRATVTVVDQDQQPTLDDAKFDVLEDAATGVVVGTLDATDPDGDTVSYAITGGDDDGRFAIDPVTGEITVAGALDHEATSSYSLSVQATAGELSDTATVTISVTDVNEPPALAAIADRTVTEDDAMEPVTIEAQDPDAGDTPEVSVSGLPAGVEFDAQTGTIEGTPTVPGDFTVTVIATDGKGGTATETFAITVTNVNDAPVIAGIEDVTVGEGAALGPVDVSVADVDGDHVDVTVTGLPVGVTYDAQEHTISGTPTQAGVYTVTVQAADGNGGTATEEFVLAVTDVNDAPVIVGIEPATVQATQGQPVNVTVNVDAADEDTDPLSYTVTGLPAGLSGTGNADGTITITGTPTQSGTFDATITVADGKGGTDTAVLAVVVGAPAPEPCSPVSTLPCEDVTVALPHSQSFSGTEGGLANSGFTMVDPPSARAGVDQSPATSAPSDAGVPGFEPGLVAAQDGTLTLTATKGIQYRKPPESTGTNSQLNALGVGVTGGNGGYELETTVVAPTFPASSATTATGSQQGGLWFGLGEDNYVKLAVVRVNSTQNKVQLLKEINGAATPATTYELNSAPFPAGQDVRLVLQVEDTPETGTSGAGVRASFAVNGGGLNALTDTANSASPQLPVPQSFVDGAPLPEAAAGQASFAGLYATKRNAAAADTVKLSFADFAVRDLVAPGEYEPLDVTVNFQSETAPVPSGTLRDFGEPYDVRTAADQGDGAYSYGWVRESSEDPVSLVGNGRDRDRTSGPAATDQRLDTLMHMQYGDTTGPNCTVNVCTDGSWQFKVPNGSYRVTAAVGDQGGTNGYDSQHALNAENQVLLEKFQGTAAEEYRTVTKEVGVADGELTVSAVGGSNTKINYVRIQSLSALAADTRPFVVDVRPGNRSTGAVLDEGIATDLHLVGTAANPGPVDPATVTTDTVKLFEVAPGGDVAVPGNPGSTGGGDAINFQQSAALKPNTLYRYVIDGVKDELGNTFVPFTSVFTTGTQSTGGTGGDEFNPVTGVSFEKVDLGKDGKYFSSLVVHKGYLWATTVGQGMYRYPIKADGTLGEQEAINAFVGRAAIGLVFDRDNPDVAWVTHATANLGNESQAFGSKVSRVDFATSATNPTVNDVFVNLPRSQKDHLSNSLAYGPGGQLYFLQGSNQAAGDLDSAWGNRGETLLTGAVLRFDPEAAWSRVQASGPINVQTVDKGGSYDPYATGAPLQLYATGVRNAYDLVHHSNGHLYVPTNGTASGANSPGVTVSGGTYTRTGQAGGNYTTPCTTRRIDGKPYTGPNVPAVTNHGTQRDFLFDVVQGGYYGHPNPERCEWVLNNGSNPEGAGSGGSKYPAGVQPDPNYRGWAYDFEFNKSPNGVLEYKSDTFGGKLKGRLLVVRFSNFDDVLTMQPGSNGRILGAQPGSQIGGFSGFDDPLDIVEDRDTNIGNLYVNSYDREGNAPKLYLLRVPDGQQGSTVSAGTKQLVGNQVTGAGSTNLGNVTLTNTGSQPATVQGAGVSGSGAAAFAVSTPGSTLPRTLAPGATMTVSVGFDPSSEGPTQATLTTTVDGAAGPSVQLRGLGTDGLGGANEPSLQYVLDTWGLGIDTGDDADATNEIHSDAAQRVSPTLGDAIDVETFRRFTDGPVTVEPLSVFGPTTHNPVTEVSWYAAEADGAANRIFSVGNTPASNGQTLTPTVSGSLEFDPGAEAFGLVSRWPAFADRMVYSQDARNTFSGALPNHVRVYPLVRDGAVVPHAYVVATEEHVSGFDYQDVVYVLRNVDPVTSTDPDPDPGTGTTTKVNFGTETAPLPTGYLRDFGQAYGPRSGADQGSGRSYGWVNGTTAQPEARTATGRDRDLNPDQRLDTFMHMQYQQQGNPNCTVNNCNTGHWELAVPDGSYEVTAAVGDAKTNSDPEAHQLRAEGSAMFTSPFVPSGADGTAGHHAQATVVVEVTDGRLTLDPVGGTNTKVDYVEVTPVEGGGGNGGENVVAQVDFAPQGSTPPQGWVTDSGELFSAGRGYGWVRTEGGAAKTADTRTRTEETDPLDSTLMIVDDATVAAVTDGEWEYALPNGTYTITTSVGDAGYADSTHGVSAEGVPLVAGFTPSAPGDYRQGTQTVQVNDGRLTLASTGTNTKLQWVTIATDSGADAIAPTVDLGVAGVDGPGGYVGKATVTADIADRGGSDIEFVDWTLDGEPVARPQGDVLVVDELGNHTVTVKATDAAGNSTTREVTFSVVDGDTAAIEVANPAVPRQGGEPIPGMSDDFLVMHLLASNVTTHRFRDTAQLQIKNPDADEPLVVTDLQMGAPTRPTAGVRTSTTSFSTPGTTLPLTIAPGQSTTVPVRFSGPGTKGLYGATMTIVSNAENAPRLPVQLRGAWQPMPEGGQEVTLTQVARVFGWSTEIGEPLDEANGGPLAGDEVRSRQWKRLDPSKPVHAIQLAALHGCCTAEDRFAITGTGGGGFSHDAPWGQSLLPPAATAADAPATAPVAQGSYNPSGGFAITVAGYSTDTTGNMGVRLFPVKVDGVAVPGAYVVGQDFVQNGCGGGSANCDYNDNMYLVTNVAPVAPVDTAGPADAPTGVQVSLAGNDVQVSWSPVTTPDLGGYVVERQAAGATGWTRVNAIPVSSTSLTDTGAPGNTSVTYRVLAVDTSGNASPASATAAVTTPARAQAAVRINAGGPAVTTSGVSWSAQQFGTGGKTYANAVAIGNTSDDVLYQSEYSTATGSLAYDIPVENGSYTVRLHFAEIYFGAPNGGLSGAGRRVFDVAVEGQLRLDDYDINADVGPLTATVKEFPAQVTDGKVDIDLTSVVNQAKISAVEVVPN